MNCHPKLEAPGKDVLTMKIEAFQKSAKPYRKMAQKMRGDELNIKKGNE